MFTLIGEATKDVGQKVTHSIIYVCESEQFNVDHDYRNQILAND